MNEWLFGYCVTWGPLSCEACDDHILCWRSFLHGCFYTAYVTVHMGRCIRGAALMWIHNGVCSAWQEDCCRQCCSLVARWGGTQAVHAHTVVYCIHVECQRWRQKKDNISSDRRVSCKKRICHVGWNQQQPAAQIWTHQPSLLCWKSITHSCIYYHLSDNRWFNLLCWTLKYPLDVQHQGQ